MAVPVLGELREPCACTRCHKLPAHRWALTPTPQPGTLRTPVSQHPRLCPLHGTQCPQYEHPQMPNQSVAQGGTPQPALGCFLGCSSVRSAGRVCGHEQGQIAVPILASGHTAGREPPACQDLACLGSLQESLTLLNGSQAPKKLVLGGHGCPAPLSRATGPIPGRTGECRAGMSQGSSHTPRACWLPPVEVMGQRDGMHSCTNNQAEQEQGLRIPPSRLPWDQPTHPNPMARGVLCLPGDPF